jgi:hypothetical protein
MKTKKINFTVLFLIFALTFSASYSQNTFDKSATLENSSSSFDSSALDDLTEKVDLYAFENTKPIDYYEIQDERSVAAILARAMFGFGAGIGFGENETLWCLQAAYYLQLSMFANSALYGVLGAVYEGASYNSYNQSLIDFQLRLLMFSALTRYKEVFLIYGVLAAYGIGNEKFDGFKTDINRLTASLVIGLNIILTTRVALALQTSLFTYQNYKFKPESGGDYNDNFTRFLFNKQNIFALSLLINLGRQQATN